MTASTGAIDTHRKKGRSRISNGRVLPADIDGRSVWARRFRDLIEIHLDDLGGRDACSEAERSIVRRISALEVELERLEYEFAVADKAKPDLLDLYNRTSGNLRRLLEAIGLERRAKDVTPRLSDFIAKRRAEKEAGQ